VQKYFRAGQATDENMVYAGVAFWISEATNKLSEYVILNAFPMRQRLQERASFLRYTYMAFLDVFLTVHHELTIY